MPTTSKLSLLVLTALLVLSPASPAAAQTTPPRLKISDNHRFIVKEDGTPFFYLGDTAWELFHRLTREEADRYLENRARKGFTVIQAVAIAELDGHIDPNPYGQLPLLDLDPARPDVKDGPDNDYWDHVDYIVNKANSLGLTVGFLPTWGRYWHDKIKNEKSLFTVANAEIYGQWLGARYKNNGIIWILGGDRAIDNDAQKEIIRAMARGLRKGDGGTHLITLHPRGGGGSSTSFHDEDWLDFNMRQNGHVAEFTGRYDSTRADYDRTPPKPVIDAEPIYEDHPVSFNAKSLGHSISADVRRPLYWDLFTGACGHTYGHHSVWQMWQPNRVPVNNPLMPWIEALDQPGAAQMRYARKLLESRPFLTRIPDDSIIVTDRVPTSVPGAGRYRFVATRDETGSYAMVYAPISRPFKVHMDKITGAKVKTWWFNPRTGDSTPLGEFPNIGEREFIPPDKGEMLDWVLVLDDAAKKYRAPGRIPANPSTMPAIVVQRLFGFELDKKIGLDSLVLRNTDGDDWLSVRAMKFNVAKPGEIQGHMQYVAMYGEKNVSVVAIELLDPDGKTVGVAEVDCQGYDVEYWGGFPIRQIFAVEFSVHYTGGPKIAAFRVSLTQESKPQDNAPRTGVNQP